MAHSEHCSSCGAPIHREFGKSVVCEYCGSFIAAPQEERRMDSSREGLNSEELDNGKDIEITIITGKHDKQKDDSGKAIGRIATFFLALWFFCFLLLIRFLDTKTGAGKEYVPISFIPLIISMFLYGIKKWFY